MTVGRERYTLFLEQFTAISEPYMTQDVIQIIKQENKTTINSTRVLEKIKDIKSLLCVFEKRGVVQYNDLRALKRIANYFVKDIRIKQLICDYEQWLQESSSNVNFLYSSGKSYTLLNQNDINKHKINETENSCYILDEIINNKSEEHKNKSEQCNEPLLPKEPCINIISSNFIENNFTTFINEQKPPPTGTKKRRYIIPLVLVILLILLICIILFIVKLYYQSLAILPKDDQGLQIPMEPNRPNSSHYMSSINIGIAAQSSFEINQTHTASTYVPVTPVDAEKRIQDIITRKISQRIGKYFWKDVCRYLKIPEGDIINIEDDTRSPRTIENMFTEALQMYFLEQRPNWRKELMDALSQANRNDLKDTVLEILSQNSFR